MSGCRNLGWPTNQGPAEGSNLARELVVLEVVGELGEVALGHLGVGNVVEEPHGFFGMPGVGDLAARVAGS